MNHIKRQLMSLDCNRMKVSGFRTQLAPIKHITLTCIVIAISETVPRIRSGADSVYFLLIFVVAGQLIGEVFSTLDSLLRGRTNLSNVKLNQRIFYLFCRFVNPVFLIVLNFLKSDHLVEMLICHFLFVM